MLTKEVLNLNKNVSKENKLLGMVSIRQTHNKRLRD